MGIPLLEGRDFDTSDHENAVPVLIVPEAMARRYWPEESPVGQRFYLSASDETGYLVVGLVGDVHQHGPSLSEDFVQLYMPFAGLALLAIWLPARRASRLDPTLALRYE